MTGYPTIIDSIDVPGVGIVRTLSDVDIAKLKHAARASREDLRMALACGHTLKRFRRLPDEDKAAVRRAVYALTSPANV